MKRLAVLTTLTALLLGFCTVASAWEITFSEDRPRYRRNHRRHHRYNRQYRNNYCSTRPVYYSPNYGYNRHYNPRYETVSFSSPYSTRYDRYTVVDTVFLY